MVFQIFFFCAFFRHFPCASYFLGLEPTYVFYMYLLPFTKKLRPNEQILADDFHFTIDFLQNGKRIFEHRVKIF
jgi:hypothetical protein